MTSQHPTSETTSPARQQQQQQTPPSTTSPRRPPVTARAPLSPLPPPDPQPWIWRCHGCGTVFRLSCTRRCLECGHVLCSAPGVSRRGRRTRPCLMEFDYVGWAAQGRWRRDAVGAWPSSPRPGEDATAGQRKRKLPASWDDEGEESSRREAGPGRNCWRSCDFPSQCRYAGQQEAPRSGDECARVGEVGSYYDDTVEDDDEAERLFLATAEYFGIEPPGSADDLLPIDPALEFEIFSDVADAVVVPVTEEWEEWWNCKEEDGDGGTAQNENVNTMNDSEK